MVSEHQHDASTKRAGPFLTVLKVCHRCRSRIPLQIIPRSRYRKFSGVHATPPGGNRLVGTVHGQSGSLETGHCELVQRVFGRASQHRVDHQPGTVRAPDIRAARSLPRGRPGRRPAHSACRAPAGPAPNPHTPLPPPAPPPAAPRPRRRPFGTGRGRRRGTPVRSSTPRQAWQLQPEWRRRPPVAPTGPLARRPPPVPGEPVPDAVAACRPAADVDSAARPAERHRSWPPHRHPRSRDRPGPDPRRCFLARFSAYRSHPPG